MLELGQFGVGLLDDDVHVGNTLFVFGNFAEVLGALFDLKLNLVSTLQNQIFNQLYPFRFP